MDCTRLSKEELRLVSQTILIETHGVIAATSTVRKLSLVYKEEGSHANLQDFYLKNEMNLP